MQMCEPRAGNRFITVSPTMAVATRLPRTSAAPAVKSLSPSPNGNAIPRLVPRQAVSEWTRCGTNENHVLVSLVVPPETWHRYSQSILFLSVFTEHIIPECIHRAYDAYIYGYMIREIYIKSHYYILC